VQALSELQSKLVVSRANARRLLRAVGDRAKEAKAELRREHRRAEALDARLKHMERLRIAEAEAGAARFAAVASELGAACAARAHAEAEAAAVLAREQAEVEQLARLERTSAREEAAARAAAEKWGHERTQLQGALQTALESLEASQRARDASAAELAALAADHRPPSPVSPTAPRPSPPLSLTMRLKLGRAGSFSRTWRPPTQLDRNFGKRRMRHRRRS
jgi:hypothetical protein